MRNLTKEEVLLIVELVDDWEKASYMEGEMPEEVSWKRKKEEIYGMYKDIHKTSDGDYKYIKVPELKGYTPRQRWIFAEDILKRFYSGDFFDIEMGHAFDCENMRTEKR